MINEIELRKLDLNLLLTFSALMQARSTTGAAKRLYLGQSAVSMALKRLREHFGDELFVRVGRSMEPTARAATIFDELEPALVQIQGLLRGGEAFAPEAAAFELRIGLTDDLELVLLPLLVRRITRVAPNIDLSVRRAPLSDVDDMVRHGDIDMALSYYPALPRWMAREVVGEARFLLLYDSDRLDLAPKPSLEDYAKLKHILVTFSGTRKGLMDESLDEAGLSRRIGLSVPGVASIPGVLKGSSFVATLPDYVARHLATEHGFALAEPPLTPPRADISLVWHRRRTSEPAHHWARRQLHGAYRDLYA